MTAIVVTAAQIGVVDPIKSHIKPYVAAAAITRGQAVYVDSAGKVNLCDANGSGTKQFRGIALKTVAAGEATDVLQEGELYGFTLAGAYDSLVYVGDTAGELADAAGSTAIVVGRVSVLTNYPTLTKVLRVTTRWEADWA
jgi:predicted RecA/RadA family phage recombinase